MSVFCCDKKPESEYRGSTMILKGKKKIKYRIGCIGLADIL